MRAADARSDGTDVVVAGEQQFCCTAHALLDQMLARSHAEGTAEQPGEAVVRVAAGGGEVGRLQAAVQIMVDHGQDALAVGGWQQPPDTVGRRRIGDGGRQGGAEMAQVQLGVRALAWVPGQELADQSVHVSQSGASFASAAPVLALTVALHQQLQIYVPGAQAADGRGDAAVRVRRHPRQLAGGELMEAAAPADAQDAAQAQDDQVGGRPAVVATPAALFAMFSCHDQFDGCVVGADGGEPVGQGEGAVGVRVTMMRNRLYPVQC